VELHHAHAGRQSLKRTGVIDLPGPKRQRFDYLTMDDEGHYLLSAHLSPGILYVIDVRTNTLVKAIQIPGVPESQGSNAYLGSTKSTRRTEAKRRSALWICGA
jgi:hypothetical protein